VGGRLLEVGSGSLGLGEYWDVPFVGCDVIFHSRPAKNMRAVRCSGHQLPFRDHSFDAVVVSDVIEHVPPAQRRTVIAEAIRVSRGVVIVGYPCGQAASRLDRDLYRDYRNRHKSPPAWLVEHIQHAFPDEELMTRIPGGWEKNIIPNESLTFHRWMMKAEMSRIWNRLFRIALRAFPRLVGVLLQRANREPSYRKIFVLTRGEERSHA
jgi:hypothetical protein